MPFLLLPLSWALNAVGLNLTFTGAAAGMGAISSWAVSTSSGVLLVSATTAMKAFAAGGIGAVLALLD